MGWPERIGLGLVVVVAVLLRRRMPGVTLGLAWFGVALLPVSNLLPVRGLLAGAAAAQAARAP